MNHKVVTIFATDGFSPEENTEGMWAIVCDKDTVELEIHEIGEDNKTATMKVLEQLAITLHHTFMVHTLKALPKIIKNDELIDSRLQKPDQLITSFPCINTLGLVFIYNGDILVDYVTRAQLTPELVTLLNVCERMQTLLTEAAQTRLNQITNDRLRGTP